MIVIVRVSVANLAWSFSQQIISTRQLEVTQAWLTSETKRGALSDNILNFKLGAY